MKEEALTRQEMMSRDRKGPRSDVIRPKSPGSGCRRPKTRVFGAFAFLQGCRSQDEALTSQEMPRDPM